MAAPPVDTGAAGIVAPAAKPIEQCHRRGRAGACRAVSLSDVDLYVLLPTRRLCRAAECRASDDRFALRDWLLERGLAAPLEAAFLTPPDLARLPARPATLELRAGARVIEGDPGWRERVPAHT